MERRKTRKIMVGNVAVGGDAPPITVQSMTNTITKDIDSTVKQIQELEEAGCHIVRAAITDLDDAKAIKKSKRIQLFPLLQIFNMIINWL